MVCNANHFHFKLTLLICMSNRGIGGNGEWGNLGNWGNWGSREEGDKGELGDFLTFRFLVTNFGSCLISDSSDVVHTYCKPKIPNVTQIPSGVH
ncbi:hypothetical protein PF005_g17812 [Phytophthora fragariae]|uniref:Uncharacterized protein n=1 Tax=Phytophthora fragariae TaxID=53985 RepID=A0A6A3X981_9STRA|nr:hypothetical protein PF005_g17812 [Phytophthora fragariae]